MPPDDRFIVAGGVSVFQCTALSFLEHHTEWTFTNSDGNSTVIITTREENNSRYSINNNRASPSFGMLVVRDVEYSDRGQYRCTAMNEVGTDSASASLTVHGM